MEPLEPDSRLTFLNVPAVALQANNDSFLTVNWITTTSRSSPAVSTKPPATQACLFNFKELIKFNLFKLHKEKVNKVLHWTSWSCSNSTVLLQKYTFQRYTVFNRHQRCHALLKIHFECVLEYIQPQTHTHTHTHTQPWRKVLCNGRMTPSHRKTANVLMLRGRPLNTDSSVSFTYCPLHVCVCVCVCVCVRVHREETKLNQYPSTDRSASLSLIISLPLSLTHSLLSSFLPALPPPAFHSHPCVSEAVTGTYLAEEMTSLCLSESRILARWEATESAYWVMWTWERERGGVFRLCIQISHRNDSFKVSHIWQIFV